MIPTPEKPFSSPGEEIAWLEKELKARKEGLEGEQEVKDKFNATKEILREAGNVSEEIISETYRLKPEEMDSHSHALSEEPHHRQIDELLSIAKEHGLLNSLKVAIRLKNPHLLDDFHDRLIAEGYISKK